MTGMKKIERIRHGGEETHAGFLFEITGGDAALDLANTVVDRLAPESKDNLSSYGDLVSWAEQAHVVTRSESRSLLRLARGDAAAAGRAFRRAIHLRERLYALFGEADLSAASLRAVDELASEAARHRHLLREGDEVRWVDDCDSLDAITWRVAASAAALLTSERRSRIRVCAGVPCRWLFIDESRRGNRRWCDMSVCGNRAKARRHYAKTRSGE
jgi:predicted RNA-binding Zn ribbon-like protein